MFNYPMELVLRERTVLVFGGGIVAVRKITGLLDCGAQVRIIAPELEPAILSRLEPGRMSWLQESFAPHHLESLPPPVLVFAATSSKEVNLEIAAQCRQKGLLCNSADDPSVSGFLVPAVVRRGAVSVAVSTEGLSPALSRLLKERIDAWLEPGWADLVALFGSMRSEVKRLLGDSSTCQRFWREISLAAQDERRYTVKKNKAWFRTKLNRACTPLKRKI